MHVLPSAQRSFLGSSRGMPGGESEPGQVVWTYQTSAGLCMEANLSYQTSSLEIVWATLSGSQCTLNTGRFDVKTMLLRVEEPRPLPVYFCRNLFTGSREFGLDWGLGEEDGGCGATMEESTCPCQSCTAVLLEAEIAKEENPGKDKLTSGAIWLHNSLSLRYLLFAQQQRLVPLPMSRPPCTRH